jgi:hypothetical protein
MYPHGELEGSWAPCRRRLGGLNAEGGGDGNGDAEGDGAGEGDGVKPQVIRIRLGSPL